MNGRVVEASVNLMRKLYKLGEAYEPITCNVKKNSVELVMANELIELKAKFPTMLIEDNIDSLLEEEE